MRDNVVELPAERRVFRPPLDDCLGEAPEVGVRFGGEIQHSGEPAAVVEPGLEGLMPNEYLADRGAYTLVDPARIEKREEDGDMGRDTGTGRGVKPVTPCSYCRLRFRDPHDQPGLPCLKPMRVVVLHRICLSAGADRQRPDCHRHAKHRTRTRSPLGRFWAVSGPCEVGRG
jgi:hypothetical protein